MREPSFPSLCACALAALLGLGPACASSPPPSDEHVYQRAAVDRSRLLELEVERLRADLAEAEETLVAIESGLRETHSRADAVSAFAAARIQLERARQRVPWQKSSLREAQEKLDEAERQIAEGHFGSAMFFAARGARIARQAMEEASTTTSPDARSIAGSRVNLREGPSLEHAVIAILVAGTPVLPARTEGEWVLVRTTDGRVGWVHEKLIR